MPCRSCQFRRIALNFFEMSCSSAGNGIPRSVRSFCICFVISPRVWTTCVEFDVWTRVNKTFFSDPLIDAQFAGNQQVWKEEISHRVQSQQMRIAAELSMANVNALKSELAEHAAVSMLRFMFS